MEISLTTHSPKMLQPFEHGFKKSWVANILMGRVCSNWKATTLMALTIFHVMVATVSFFSGEWILSSLFLLNAGVDAILHREFRDITNLRKMTVRHALNNSAQRVENFRLKKSNDHLEDNIGKFKGQVDNLKGQVYKITALTKAQEEQIARNTLIQDALESNLTRMKTTLQGQEELTAEQRRELIQTILHLEGQKETLKTFNQQMSKELHAKVKDFETVATQVKSMNADGIRVLREAELRLTELGTAQREREQTLRLLDGQLAERQRELARVAQELTKRQQELAETSQHLRLAAAGNILSGQVFQKMVFQARGQAPFHPDSRRYVDRAFNPNLSAEITVH